MADNSSRTAVIVDGARTPIGRFMGGLAPLSAPELGGIAIRAAKRNADRVEALDYSLKHAQEHGRERWSRVNDRVDGAGRRDPGEACLQQGAPRPQAGSPQRHWRKDLLTWTPPSFSS